MSARKGSNSSTVATSSRSLRSHQAYPRPMSSTLLTPSSARAFKRRRPVGLTRHLAGKLCC